MTRETETWLLGCIYGAIPGGVGWLGILNGIEQARLGPVIVGCVFLLIAVWTADSFKQRVKK